MFQCFMVLITQYNFIRYIYMVSMFYVLDCKALRVIFNQVMRYINTVNNEVNNNNWKKLKISSEITTQTDLLFSKRNVCQVL